MPVAVLGATIVRPPQMPCEPAKPHEMAAILCMRGVWGWLESNWEGLIMRTPPWTLDGVSRLGCSFSFVLIRVTPFVKKGSQVATLTRAAFRLWQARSADKIHFQLA